MERKILQIIKNGRKEDCMPIMDDLSIYTNGKTLKAELQEIKDDILYGKLFLGVFESENKLKEKYPDGTKLEAGTYAIVTDIDAFFIYDTDTLKWKASNFSATGILELNGKTASNGKLTIYGEDINATVPSAAVPTQTISNHLESLAIDVKNVKDQLEPIYLIGRLNQSEYGSYTLEFADVPNELKDKTYEAIVRLINKETNYRPNGSIQFKITYMDGTTLTGNVANSVNSMATSEPVSRGDFDFINFASYHAIFRTKVNRQKEIQFITINGDYRINNSEFTKQDWSIRDTGGFYNRIFLNKAIDLSIISCSQKNEDGTYTSAVIDYQIDNNGKSDTIIELYSDKKIDGKILFAIK